MSSRCLKVALLEPFFGGSHRVSAEGWARRSRHAVELFTLPARFWKWRMRGASFELAKRLRSRVARGEVDVIFATSLLDLAHLSALLPRRIPTALYFHENQVSYPPRSDRGADERDLQYSFTNLASALAADRVAFNSSFQRELFLGDLGRMLKRMPDVRPTWAVEEIRRKSEVLALGVELSDIGPPCARPPEEPLLVLWNHRWEYDKAPQDFFGVLGNLAQKGVRFCVAVAGEDYARVPPVFEQSRRALADRIDHWGYLSSREDYVRLLVRADIVVSTAVQENFGLSVVEAAYAGAHPLVPARLSYPEVLPETLHAACLYTDVCELEAKMERLLRGQANRVPSDVLRERLSAHAWENRAVAFDEWIDQVFGSNSACSVV